MTSTTVRLTLFPDLRLLRLVDQAAREYLNAFEFPPSLVEMLANSLSEACEELLRVCGEQAVCETFEVCFDFQDEAAVFQVIYSSQVDLSPHEVPVYSAPTAQTDETALDALWLHLIKARMDRVRFRVEGARRVFEMTKYRRSETQARQFWVMGLIPKLRKDIVLHPTEDQLTAGKTTGLLLQDPVAGVVLKLGSADAFIVQHFDGKTTFHEIYLDYVNQIGMIAPRRLAQLYETLEHAGMLAGTGARPQANQMQVWLRRVLAPQFSIPHADALVIAIHARVKYLLNPLGVVLLLLLGFSGLVPLAESYDRFLQVLATLDQYYFKHPWQMLPPYLLVLACIVIHELAHGVVCKHFGGRVERIGVMWYLAMFTFYCDTSAAWNFATKRQRMLVSLGGPIISFAVLGVFLWLTAWADQHAAAWAVMLVTADVFLVLGLVMNFNPFIRMDAYYILMDWTGIANLRSKSFAYLRRLLFGWLIPVRTPAEEREPAGRRNKVLLLVYGVTGSLVTVLFMGLPLLRLAQELNKHRGWSFYAVFSAFVAGLLISRIAQQVLQKFHALRYREYRIS